MKEVTLNLDISVKLAPIFENKKRYVVLRGGRGSGKSWAFADFLIFKLYQSQKRALCTREIQKSIKDSVHKLLCDRIKKHGLDWFFTITERTIVGRNGSEFLFKGLRHNPDDIKSTEGIDYAWVEEGQSTSRKSLEILIPTIRKENSQILIGYNPTNDDDPVHTDFTLIERDDTLNIECNYNDNPFFPEILRQEMEYDKRTDYDKYLHIWEGKCVKHSEAQVFYGKWKVEEFDVPKGTFFYFGADWGFSNDPSVLVRCFVLDKKLFIDQEFYEVGVDIDYLPERFKRIPESVKFPIIADSARPDTINYIKRNGFPLIKGARKGKGSIEDGVAHIRGYEQIVIHPRCKHTIDEFRLYSYIVDDKTGAISNKLEDKNNHIIDSLRYALQDLVKGWNTELKPNYKMNQVLGWG